jgi:hypothetical protein
MFARSIWAIDEMGRPARDEVRSRKEISFKRTRRLRCESKRSI